MLEIIAGCALILGAYFVYKGQIFYSVGSYLISDIIWVVLSILSGHIIGGIIITIGTLLGLGAFYKMHVGIFKKDIICAQ